MDRDARPAARALCALAATTMALWPGCDCAETGGAETPAVTSGGASEIAAGVYRSSYLVFLSDDGEGPLVVPVDVNWRPAGSRLWVELKAWIGERGGWPMRHEQAERPLSGPAPERWWEVPALEGFRFGDGGASLGFEVGGRRVSLEVPPFDEEAVTRERLLGGEVVTRVDRAALTLDGRRREGYLLQERVELPAGALAAGERLFDRFQYFPLLVCGDLFLVKDEGGGQRHAARFRPGGSPAVAELRHFHFAETRREADAESGRRDIPVAWRVALPEWGKRLRFHSTGHHTGYGAPDEEPRPVYRQASVVGTSEGERCEVHGMAELVLEGGSPPPLDAQPEIPAVLSLTALPALRTTGRPAYVRLRADNRTEETMRVRVAAASKLVDPPLQLRVTRLSVLPVELGEVHSEAEPSSPRPDDWVEIPPGRARLLEVGLADPDRWAPFDHHRYELVLERDDAAPFHVEAALDDGIRHPRRR